MENPQKSTQQDAPQDWKQYWKQYWAGILLSLITLGVFIMALKEPTIIFNQDFGRTITIDSASKVLNLKQYKFDLDTSQAGLRHVLSNKKSGKDDSLTNQNRLDSLVNLFILRKNEDAIKQFSQLNDSAFNLRKDLYHARQLDKRPNIWLLVLIILLSGIIGGFAGTRYKDLEDNLAEAAKDFKAVNALTNQIEGTSATRSTGTDNDELVKQKEKIAELNAKIDTLNTNVTTLNEQIKALKTREGEKVTTNIVFGIIASTLSFIALRTFDSKVLDFQSYTDYFIFAGFGLLGSIFAKNWIRSIYDKAIPKTAGSNPPTSTS